MLNKYLNTIGLILMVSVCFVAIFGITGSLVYDQYGHISGCLFGEHGTPCTPTEHISELQRSFNSISNYQSSLGILFMMVALVSTYRFVTLNKPISIKPLFDLSWGWNNPALARSKTVQPIL
jgi:hypothetical protein